MKRTGAGILIIALVVGAVVGFVLDTMLTSMGRATFTPAASLPTILALLGVVIVVLAVPVFRASRGRSARRIDPFRALRIAMLAKASSLVGAAALGFALGLLGFLATRPVTPSIGSMGSIIATLVCAVLLVVAGLVAEQLCTIRKDDDDDTPGNTPAGPVGA
jgi:DMSO reductase anchor subunit